MRDDIIVILRSDGPKTAMELQSMLGISYVANVRQALYALERQGYIKRMVGTRPTLWMATDIAYSLFSNNSE